MLNTKDILTLNLVDGNRRGRHQIWCDDTCLPYSNEIYLPRSLLTQIDLLKKLLWLHISLGIIASFLLNCSFCYL